MQEVIDAIESLRKGCITEKAIEDLNAAGVKWGTFAIENFDTPHARVALEISLAIRAYYDYTTEHKIG